MTAATYVDLYYLATAPEPTRDEDRQLLLHYQPADGSPERKYGVWLTDAWCFEGNPYELLSGRFEDYDDAGSAWFTEGWET